MIHTMMTPTLTREDMSTVIKVCRLASALEMPAKIRPSTLPSASRVGT